MRINNYKEKEIRNAILNKVDPKIKSGKHDKGYIYIGDKVVAKVKIPNNHNDIMYQSRSKFIARDLKLDHEDFNKLVDCDLRGPGYYKKLARFV